MAEAAPAPAPVGLDELGITIPDPAPPAALLAATTGLAHERDGDAHVLLDDDGEPRIRCAPGPFLAAAEVTYAVAPGVLGPLVEQVEAAGVEVRSSEGRGGREEARVTDPDGNALVLRAGDPVLRADRRPVTLVHPGFEVRELARSEAFYTGALGLAVSDWIDGTAAFLRCPGGFHHSMALLVTGGRRVGLEHVCVALPDFDALMRSRARALRLAGPLESDLLRHSPSGSISFYYWLAGPGSLRVEHCIEHEMVGPAGRTPRRLPPTPETRDMWSA